MKIRKLYLSSQYRKSFNKLPFKTKQTAVEKLEIFQKDSFDPRLKTHKLSGRLKKQWSFSVDYSIRVMFEFVGEETVGLIDIGAHKIYKR